MGGRGVQAGVSAAASHAIQFWRGFSLSFLFLFFVWGGGVSVDGVIEGLKDKSQKLKLKEIFYMRYALRKEVCPNNTINCL